jgi:hypothetical protein
MKSIRMMAVLPLAIGAVGCETYDPTTSTRTIALVHVAGGADRTILRETDRHDSLAVRVLDKSGNPLRGAAVSWTQNDEAGRISPAFSYTDSHGIAKARWSVSGLPGLYHAVAGFEGESSEAFEFRVRSTSARAIVLADGYQCIVTSDGVLACSHGIGERPRPMLTEHRFRDLQQTEGVGARYSICALATTGSVWCAPTVAAGLTFTAVGGQGLRTLDGGSGAWCGISTNHELWCWGRGAHGLRGDSVASRDDVSVPHRVDIPGAGPFKEVAMGSATACAVSWVGELWCWGRDWGVIGLTYSGQLYGPTRIAAGIPLSQFALALENNSGCGLAQDGRAYCKGDSYQISRAPGARVLRDFGFAEGSGRFAAIRAVADGYIVLARDGSAYLWGSANFGDIGGIRAQMQKAVVFGDRGLRNIFADAPTFGAIVCVDMLDGAGTACMDGQAGFLWYNQHQTDFWWRGILPIVPIDSL